MRHGIRGIRHGRQQAGKITTNKNPENNTGIIDIALKKGFDNSNNSVKIKI
jgi:hypothetical protein